MEEKYSNTNGNIYPKNNYYLLSSWNYGSFSPSNPFYKSQFFSNKKIKNIIPNIAVNKKIFPRSTTTTQLNTENIPIYQETKRHLKQEERIVTNELLDCLNHYNKMQKYLKKGTFRPKSVNRIMNSKLIKENGNESKISEKKPRKLKSNTSDYKYKLTYTEWISVKNKQREIFTEILNKQKEEENLIEQKIKKIDIKYNEIKEQKYKDWIKKKNIEKLMQKEKQRKEQIKEEENKKKKEEKKEEVMNRWFKIQAEKMEKEIFAKKEKLILQREKEQLKKLEKKEKQILNRKAFIDWKKKKEREMKKKKNDEKKEREKEEEKRKREYLKRKVKSFTIGPYTDAAALKEVQNYLVENNLKKEGDEYYQENSEYESRQ